MRERAELHAVPVARRFSIPSDAEIEQVGETIEQLVVEFEEAIDDEDLDFDDFSA